MLILTPLYLQIQHFVTGHSCCGRFHVGVGRGRNSRDGKWQLAANQMLRGSKLQQEHTQICLNCQVQMPGVRFPGRLGGS